jgi:hypothetical protein
MKIGIPKLLIIKGRRQIIPNSIVTTDYVTLGFAQPDSPEVPYARAARMRARSFSKSLPSSLEEPQNFGEKDRASEQFVTLG